MKIPASPIYPNLYNNCTSAERPKKKKIPCLRKRGITILAQAGNALILTSVSDSCSSGMYEKPIADNWGMIFSQGNGLVFFPCSIS